MSAETQFRKDVLDAMAPIIDKFDYHIVESDDSYVRLDSDVSSIQVQYDRRRSYEVGIEFSEQENGIVLKQIPFNLGEVFREFGVPDATERSFFQSSDPVMVRNFLTSTCDLLIKYCAPVLRGDPVAYAALNERRSREAETYTRQLQIQAIRDQANKAWHDQRYEDFVNLLSKFKEFLSEADQEKLKYAEKKLAQS